MTLRDYFPLLPTREDLLKNIHSDQRLELEYGSWKEKYRQEFLDFCTGEKGVKILYDSFFKEVLNPEYAAGRLEDWLSVLLGEQVKILSVLPNDSTRIADETSLLVTDIVVELGDGSIANVEVQKVGYMFPGQWCACYSADLLLRQYKRVRDQSREHKFSYKDIKTVYTIVLYENSPREFHPYKDIFIHRAEQVVDSGVKLNLLQKYIFLPLDIFKKTHHNKPIENKLEAWLTFFSAEEPDEIINLIESYPEFIPLYKDLSELCRNTKKVMGMFSKELQELDRNTVSYMIDEMQEEINQQKAELEGKNMALQKKDVALQEKDVALQEQKNKLEEKDNMLQKKDMALQKQQEEIAILKQQLSKLQNK